MTDVAPDMPPNALWFWRAAGGLGVIFVGFSEVMFYPVQLTPDFALVAAAYSLCAMFALGLLTRFGHGVAGLFAISALIGLLAEGVIVATIYDPSLFSVVWTPLAWHGLISGLIGVWLMRRSTLSVKGVVAALSFGLYLGAWGAYFWGHEGDALSVASPQYIVQSIAAYALVMLGHWVLPRSSAPKASRLALWGSAALLAGWFALTAVLIFGLLSLMLFPLVGMCVLVAKAGARQSAPLWAPRFSPLLLTLTFIAAVVGFHGFYGSPWVSEFNVLTIMTAGPVSVGLFLVWAWKGLRSGRTDTASP